MADVTRVKLVRGQVNAMVARVLDLNATPLVVAGVSAITRTVRTWPDGTLVGAAEQALVVADSIFDEEPAWGRYRPVDVDADAWRNFRDLLPPTALPADADEVTITYRVLLDGGDCAHVLYRARLIANGVD